MDVLKVKLAASKISVMFSQMTNPAVDSIISYEKQYINLSPAGLKVKFVLFNDATGTH